MGKGSVPRPFSVANEEYAKRWDAIFGRDETSEEEEDDDDVDYICPQCSGSGEGMWDGASCTKCGGSGGWPLNRERDYD